MTFPRTCLSYAKRRQSWPSFLKPQNRNCPLWIEDRDFSTSLMLMASWISSRVTTSNVLCFSATPFPYPICKTPVRVFWRPVEFLVSDAMLFDNRKLQPPAGPCHHD